MKKKIRCYIVKNILNPLKIYTLTTTKKEAEEYINKRLFLENQEDFDSWCFYHKVPENERDSYWPQYFNKRLSPEKKLQYTYFKAYYTLDEVCSMIRMFCGCQPIGCSYDTDYENLYISKKQTIESTLTRELNNLLKEVNGKDDSPDDPENQNLVQ